MRDWPAPLLPGILALVLSAADPDVGGKRLALLAAGSWCHSVITHVWVTVNGGR